MNKIINNDFIEGMKSTAIKEVINDHLKSSYELARSRAAIFLGLKLNESYAKYAHILLQEMNEEIHFENVRLGVKSAWTIAVVLAENLNKKDYQKLKEELDKWEEEEKQGLISWLKDFPDQIKILTEGRL